MLEFNPYFRPTAAQCLKSPIFDKIRAPNLETKCPNQLHLEIDDDPNFGIDYEADNQPVSDSELIETFRSKIIEEAMKLKR